LNTESQKSKIDFRLRIFPPANPELLYPLILSLSKDVPYSPFIKGRFRGIFDVIASPSVEGRGNLSLTTYKRDPSSLRSSG
jgi:hypothetical protein